MIRLYLVRFFSIRPLLLLAAGLQLLALGSCSSTKSLPPGRKLYIGHKLELQSDTIIPTKKTLLPELESVITPKPNTSFFGIRPGLWIYNMGNPARKKGLGAWIRRKFGQEPVLLDSVKTKNVISLLHNRLNNNGYFGSKVTFQVQEKKERMATVVYTAQVSTPYRIKEIHFPTGDSISEAAKAIAGTQATTLLKAGELYNLNTLIAERIRIDGELKNKGFFFFGPDVILFKADSMRHDHTINLYVQLKPETPDRAKRAYRLNDIAIFTDYTIGYENPPKTPPVMVQGYKYYPNELSLKAKRLLPSVFLMKDSLYTRRDHALTLSRLMGLGTFQFVDLKFFEVESQPNRLNAEMRLTPVVHQSLRGEAEMVSKSNNFAGPGINLNYRHRNLMRGAELFVLGLNANQETQVGGSRSNDQQNSAADDKSNAAINSFTIGVTADLYVPRIISPIRRIRNLRSEFVPKTRFRVGANYINRVNFFQMLGYNGSYSYIWKPKATVTHELTPVNIQYVNLAKVDTAFQRRLEESPYLAQSFQNQYILGGMYNFNYNDQSRKDLRNHVFFNANIDGSGNLASLLFKAAGSTANPQTVFARPYSQYTRLDFDTRYYLQLTRGSMLATRLLTGVGFTYGNSQTLPYVKQFYIGGPNSLRAFRSRSVGPGTYRDSSATGFFDQTGDIRFEANVEYRVDLVPYVKGALFVDAGNIWLTRKTAEKPNAEFVASKFLQQLAVGAGAGIRIDAQVIVLRFDVGVPVRIPMPETDSDAPAPPAPNKKPILNIAIGYPF